MSPRPVSRSSRRVAAGPTATAESSTKKGKAKKQPEPEHDAVLETIGGTLPRVFEDIKERLGPYALLWLDEADDLWDDPVLMDEFKTTFECDIQPIEHTPDRYFPPYMRKFGLIRVIPQILTDKATDKLYPNIHVTKGRGPTCTVSEEATGKGKNRSRKRKTAKCHSKGSIPSMVYEHPDVECSFCKLKGIKCLLYKFMVIKVVDGPIRLVELGHFACWCCFSRGESACSISTSINSGYKLSIDEEEDVSSDEDGCVSTSKPETTRGSSAAPTDRSKAPSAMPETPVPKTKRSQEGVSGSNTAKKPKTSSMDLAPTSETPSHAQKSSEQSRNITFKAFGAKAQAFGQSATASSTSPLPFGASKTSTAASKGFGPFENKSKTLYGAPRSRHASPSPTPSTLGGPLQLKSPSIPPPKTGDLASSFMKRFGGTEKSTTPFPDAFKPSASLEPVLPTPLTGTNLPSPTLPPTSKRDLPRLDPRRPFGSHLGSRSVTPAADSGANTVSDGLNSVRSILESGYSTSLTQISKARDDSLAAVDDMSASVRDFQQRVSDLEAENRELLDANRKYEEGAQHLEARMMDYEEGKSRMALEKVTLSKEIEQLKLDVSNANGAKHTAEQRHVEAVRGRKAAEEAALKAEQGQKAAEEQAKDWSSIVDEAKTAIGDAQAQVNELELEKAALEARLSAGGQGMTGTAPVLSSGQSTVQRAGSLPPNFASLPFAGPPAPLNLPTLP